MRNLLLSMEWETFGLLVIGKVACGFGRGFRSGGTKELRFLVGSVYSSILTKFGTRCQKNLQFSRFFLAIFLDAHRDVHRKIVKFANRVLAAAKMSFGTEFFGTVRRFGTHIFCQLRFTA